MRRPSRIVRSLTLLGWFAAVGATVGVCPAQAAPQALPPAIAWGRNNNGQCTVPDPPAGLTYVELSGGNEHTVARLSDGTLAAWGKNTQGQCNVPPPPAGLTFV